MIKTLLLLSVLFLFSGCQQKIYEWEEIDETGKTVAKCRIKVNGLASDSSADSIELELPNNVTIKVSKYANLSDSFKIRFNPLTNTYEIVTTGDQHE